MVKFGFTTKKHIVLRLMPLIYPKRKIDEHMKILIDICTASCRILRFADLIRV